MFKLKVVHVVCRIDGYNCLALTTFVSNGGQGYDIPLRPLITHCIYGKKSCCPQPPNTAYNHDVPFLLSHTDFRTHPVPREEVELCATKQAKYTTLRNYPNPEMLPHSTDSADITVSWSTWCPTILYIGIIPGICSVTMLRHRHNAEIYNKYNNNRRINSSQMLSSLYNSNLQLPSVIQNTLALSLPLAVHSKLTGQWGQDQ